MTPEQTMALVKQANLLLTQFESSAKSIREDTLRNTNMLGQSIKDSQQKTQEMMTTSKKYILEETNRAIQTALEAQTQDFEKRLKQSVSEIERSIGDLYKQRQWITQQTKFLTWKSVIAVTLMCAVFIGITTYKVWENTKELELIDYRKEVKAVLNKLPIRSCNQQACIKVGDLSQRWEGNSEYILIPNE